MSNPALTSSTFTLFPDKTSVVIIGAGLSGLYAAWQLARRGVDFIILEARPTTGGRILSVSLRDDHAPENHDHRSSNGEPCTRIDLGPTWYWPAFQTDLDRVIQELGLQTFEQFDSGDTVVETHVRSGHATATGSSGQGAEVRRVPGYAMSAKSMRLVGGMQSLIDALVKRVGNQRIFCNTRVTRIELRQDDAEPCFSSGSSSSDPGTSDTVLNNSVHAAIGHRSRSPEIGPRTCGVTVHATVSHGQSSVIRIHADRVLLGVPPRLVSESIGFEPALPDRLIQSWGNTPTWMAPHAKYVAVFKTPFWREQGLSGQGRSNIGPLVEIHDASPYCEPMQVCRSGALFGFIGVPAHTRARVSPDQMKAQCRAQLVRMFGSAAQTPIAEYLKDWSVDPFTSTELDRDPSIQSQGHAQAPEPRPTRGPWRLRVCGIASEWSTTFPGYLAGAIDQISY